MSCRRVKELPATAQGDWVLSPGRSRSGHRLLLGEPGAGGEHLVEAVGPQRLADLGHQLGLSLAAASATPAARPGGAGPRPPRPAVPPARGRPPRAPTGRTRPGTRSRCGCCGSPGSGPAPRPAAPWPPQPALHHARVPRCTPDRRRARRRRTAPPGRAARSGDPGRRRSGRAVVSRAPRVRPAKAVQKGSSWPRSCSRLADASRRAPSQVAGDRPRSTPGPAGTRRAGRGRRSRPAAVPGAGGPTAPPGRRPPRRPSPPPSTAARRGPGGRECRRWAAAARPRGGPRPGGPPVPRTATGPGTGAAAAHGRGPGTSARRRPGCPPRPAAARSTRPGRRPAAAGRPARPAPGSRRRGGAPTSAASGRAASRSATNSRTVSSIRTAGPCSRAVELDQAVPGQRLRSAPAPGPHPARPPGRRPRWSSRR